MTSLAACTIVAHNYLPLARVLARSFVDQHPTATFLVAVIDHSLLTRTLDEGFFEVMSITDIDFGEEGFEDMATAYDVTEFATAIKPFLLRQLLDAYDCVLYLDPDIHVYAPLTPIVEATMVHGISLTPHCLEPMAHDGMGPTEAEIMAAGIYNLGYIGVSGAGRPFLDWWATRLRRGALNDPSNQMFTDQRWVDLAIPVYSPYIERSPTYNVAYWNIDQRMLWIKGRVPMIDDEPLRFFHFSGYEPNTPHWLCKYQVHAPRTLLSEHASLATLCTEYGAALEAAGYGQPGLHAYGWGQAFPQLSMTKAMRRMFHGELVKSDVNSAVERPPSPFKAHGAKLFRDWLCAVPQSGSLPLPRFLQLIWHAREDIRAQFPEALGGDMTRLLCWLQRSIEPEATELRVLCAQFAVHAPESSVLSVRIPELQQEGINLIGYLKAELGVGEAGRLVHSALTSVGVSVSTFACQGSKNRHADPFQLSGQACHGITLLSVNADQIETVRKQFEVSFFDSRYVIGQWFWEVEKFPQTFDRAFSLLDEVWVATKYIQSAISLANPSASVHLMPLPLIAPVINPVIRKVDFGLDERFAFLFSFDMNSVFERKNPIGLVTAFCQAFTPGEGPVLIIKIINGDSNLKSLEKLRWLCRHRIDIKIIDQYFDAAMMGSLMAVCDSYVSLHRAEGLGLTMAQAMCLGKPVIATAYSGNMDFMSEHTAYLIPWTPIKVGAGCPPYPEEAVWADPDLTAAAHTMREVAYFPDRAMIRGDNARADLATRFSPQITGKRMHQRLQCIREQEHA
jgi:glycosyltransferase involved in cell wall biosynthesis